MLLSLVLMEPGWYPAEMTGLIAFLVLIISLFEQRSTLSYYGWDLTGDLLGMN